MTTDTIRKIFQENLNNIMNEKEKSQKALADYVGVTPASVNDWMKGKKIPRMDKIDKICMFLSVNRKDLLEQRPKNKQFSDLTASYAYPYITTPAAAGIPTDIEAIMELPTLTVPNVLMGRHAGSRNIIIMRINGDSMNRAIPDKAFIAVDRSFSIFDFREQDVVVFIDQFEGYSVKRFEHRNHRYIFRPYSTNPDYYDITFNEGDTVPIIGKVVAYFVSLD